MVPIHHVSAAGVVRNEAGEVLLIPVSYTHLTLPTNSRV